MKPYIPVVVALLIAVMLSGCLGGDDKKDPRPPEVMGGSQQASGSGSGLAQITPEVITSSLDVNLDQTDLISITVNVTVEDGDADTNPDSVQEASFASEGNLSATGGGGTTPAAFQLKIEWDGTTYLPSSWTFTISVSCVASDDQWPGPLIWRGIPDRGFSYDLDITYEYHSSGSEL
jgi:hypothetical protein